MVIRPKFGGYLNMFEFWALLKKSTHTFDRPKHRLMLLELKNGSISRTLLTATETGQSSFKHSLCQLPKCLFSQRKISIVSLSSQSKYSNWTYSITGCPLQDHILQPWTWSHLPENEGAHNCQTLYHYLCHVWATLQLGRTLWARLNFNWLEPHLVSTFRLTYPHKLNSNK